MQHVWRHEYYDKNVCQKSPSPKNVHCKGDHPAYAEKNPCPEYKKQIEIKKITTLESKTFIEAQSSVRSKSFPDKVVTDSA